MRAPNEKESAHTLCDQGVKAGVSCVQTGIAPWGVALAALRGPHHVRPG